MDDYIDRNMNEEHVKFRELNQDFQSRCASRFASIVQIKSICDKMANQSDYNQL